MCLIELEFFRLVLFLFFKLYLPFEYGAEVVTS